MILFSVDRTITACRERCRDLLGNEIKKNTLHRNCTLQVNKPFRIRTAFSGPEVWVFFCTLQSHLVDFNQDHQPACFLQCKNTVWNQSRR